MFWGGPLHRMLVSTRARAGQALALAAAALLTLAACGGGESAADAASVDEELGLDEEGILERQSQAENLVRDCMKAEGFEYVPVDPVAQQAELTGQQGMSKEEFEAQFGYGITTLYEEKLAQTGSGPNQQIRAGLSETERAAYDRALYGDDPTATFAAALDSGDFTGLGGCLRVATDHVFGGAAALETLQSELDEVDEKIFADGRMVKAIAKWSDCMRDAGFDDLSEPHEVDAVLEEKLAEIVGPPSERVAPAPGAEPPYDGDALETLQQEEVAMVKADLACEEEHLAEIEEKVAAGYEAEFREENAELINQVQGE